MVRKAQYTGDVYPSMYCLVAFTPKKKEMFYKWWCEDLPKKYGFKKTPQIREYTLIELHIQPEHVEEIGKEFLVNFNWDYIRHRLQRILKARWYKWLLKYLPIRSKPITLPERDISKKGKFKSMPFIPIGIRDGYGLLEKDFICSQDKEELSQE